MDYLKLDIFLAACGVLLVLRYLYTRAQRLPLPPGPKPLPIIGNMLDMPKQKPWETFSKWGKEYGDIVHIHSLGKSFIVINKFSVACDLLVKRSHIYSGRPRFLVLDLIGGDSGTLAQPYGALLRRHRTMYHKQLGRNSALAFQPRQTEAARGLLRSILDTPHEYRQHLRHMAAGVVMSIAYGYDISPQADPFVALAERATQAFSRALRPGAHIVELIPALKYVPEWLQGADFQTFVRESRKVFWEFRNVPFESVRRHMAAGTAQPSFVANSLAELGNSRKSTEENLIKCVAGSIYGAGSDTTVSAIHSFILAMVLYPEVQHNAQAELDIVIGRNRLPEFCDRTQLPYVDAVVKEVLRWNPVTPTGVPHAVTEDDIYHGYHIPKGSTVIYNAWSILHDPEMYKDPFTFYPERFLPDNSGVVAQDPAITGAFGFGRRICAGRHLADASVWIAVASLLASFDISPAVDENGHAIDVRHALGPFPGLLNHPRPFPCSIKPRSIDAETLIRQTMQTKHNAHNFI